MLGLLLVTLLAGDLSARLLTAGGQLRLAEASAATLARLNDDIVRSLSSGLLSTDLDGNIRTINPTGVEMFGIAADQLFGLPVQTLLDIDMQPVLSTAGISAASRAPRPPRAAATARAFPSATRSTGSRTTTARRSACSCCSRT